MKTSIAATAARTLLASCALVAIAAAWSAPAPAQDTSGEAAPAAAQPSAPSISVVAAERRELVQLQVVTGSLVAREEVQVTPQIEGFRIVELRVEAGDRVEAGQVLAVLDPAMIRTELAQNDASAVRAEAAIAQARSQIAEAEATLAEARSSLRRATALRQSRNATQAQLDEATAAARTAEARLAAARDGVRLAEAQAAEIAASRRSIELRLERTELKAPTAGIVSEREARLGAVTSMAGGPLFRIIEKAEIELAADIAESVLGKIRVGQPAAVRVVGRDEPVRGTVRLVDPKIDTSTRLGRVRVALDDGAGLTLGTFARAEIETARREGTAVPLSAVQFGADGATVQVVENDTVRTRPVKVGINAGREIEIVEGVTPGETIVAVSGTFLRDGDRVRPVTPAATN